MRYDVAMLLREHWPILNWKGDDHTAGVYFDEEFAYMVERSYAVRMKHDEPVDGVYYTPYDDEVSLFFPYQSMTRRPNKYQLLFQQNDLTPHEIRSLFDGCPEQEVIIPVHPLMEFIESIPKKRERDITWLCMTIDLCHIKAGLFQKKKDGMTIINQTDIHHNEPQNTDVVRITVNSNAILHTLKLFSGLSTVLISNLSDRIRVTGSETKDLETILSLPNKAVLKEIESYAFYT